jgi:hypothetical protein
VLKEDFKIPHFSRQERARNGAPKDSGTFCDLTDYPGYVGYFYERPIMQAEELYFYEAA